VFYWFKLICFCCVKKVYLGRKGISPKEGNTKPSRLYFYVKCSSPQMLIKRLKTFKRPLIGFSLKYYLLESISSN